MENDLVTSAASTGAPEAAEPVLSPPASAPTEAGGAASPSVSTLSPEVAPDSAEGASSPPAEDGVDPYAGLSADQRKDLARRYLEEAAHEDVKDLPIYQKWQQRVQQDTQREYAKRQVENQKMAGESDKWAAIEQRGYVHPETGQIIPLYAFLNDPAYKTAYDQVLEWRRSASPDALADVERTRARQQVFLEQSRNEIANDPDLAHLADTFDRLVESETDTRGFLAAFLKASTKDHVAKLERDHQAKVAREVKAAVNEALAAYNISLPELEPAQVAETSGGGTPPLAALERMSPQEAARHRFTDAQIVGITRLKLAQAGGAR